MAYLLAGGYALLHRRHVRIDVIYEALSPRTRARLDAFTFVFFVAYVLTLIWAGGIDAWNSFQIGETTSTPWNPPIWPVKAAIPLAGAAPAPAGHRQPRPRPRLGARRTCRR